MRQLPTVRFNVNGGSCSFVENSLSCQNHIFSLYLYIYTLYVANCSYTHTPDIYIPNLTWNPKRVSKMRYGKEQLSNIANYRGVHVELKGIQTTSNNTTGMSLTSRGNHLPIRVFQTDLYRSAASSHAETSSEDRGTVEPRSEGGSEVWRTWNRCLPRNDPRESKWCPDAPPVVFLVH